MRRILHSSYEKTGVEIDGKKKDIASYTLQELEDEMKAIGEKAVPGKGRFTSGFM